MYYVIHVRTGNEQKVIDKMKSLEGKSHDYELFSPARKAYRKYHGRYEEHIERCFAGYVFAYTDNPSDLFVDLYRIDEYARLLGREGLTYNFSPLSEEEERMVNILYSPDNHRITEISDIALTQGDEIQILTGPLRDMKGRVKKVDLHKRKATVSITLLNRPVDVQVGINIVVKK